MDSERLMHGQSPASPVKRNPMWGSEREKRLAVLALGRCGGTWRCLVRRDIHAPHLRADAMPRTPELALASACARHLTPTPPLLRR